MSYNLQVLDKENIGELPQYMLTQFSLLRYCIAKRFLLDGRLVHNQMVKDGSQNTLLSGNLLLQLYISCGCVTDAKKHFDALHYKNIRTWAFLFELYVDQYLWKDNLSLFWQMWSEGVLPNDYIFVIVLQACAQLLNIEVGKRVHSCITKSGSKLNKKVSSALISMYTKCGCLHDARSIFDEVPSKNVVLWSAMLSGYCWQGHPKEAVRLFWQMQNDDCIEPNEIVCLSILKACTKMGTHKEGRKVHDCIVRSNLDLSVPVANTLIDMYAKCGCLIDGRRVFDNIEHPDYIAWSALIAGYGESGNSLESFKLLLEMERAGIYANEITCLNVLKACQDVEYLNQAKELYMCMISRGSTLGGCFENALVDVFAKCGELLDACHIFQNLAVRNVVSWSTIIAGHTNHGFYSEALALFKQMLEEGIWPNATTFVIVLNIAAALQHVQFGRYVHANVTMDGIELELIVGSALVVMYTKCGAVKDARHVFDKMPCRNVVAWSSMVACYAEQEATEVAFELFWRMELEGVKPDEIMFVTILQACALWAMLEHGQYVHNYALESGNANECSLLASILIDMYAKCGSLADARRVFDETKQLDATLWNVMISGYGQYGCCFEAFELLSKMICQGVLRNHVTFLGLLSACSRAGLMDEAHAVFYLISLNDLNSITAEICACWVDLLGRAGCLHQATVFVCALPFQPDVSIWLSLVGVCRLNSNVELARVGVQSLLETKPGNAVVYVLLSNIVYEAIF